MASIHPPPPFAVTQLRFPRPDWRLEEEEARERDRRDREARAEQARRVMVEASLELEEAPGDGLPARRGSRRPWSAWWRTLKGAS